MGIHVLDHPLLHETMARLRDRDTPCDDFRMLAHRISLLLTLEATRDLPSVEGTVETPLETAEGLRERGARRVRFLSIVAAPEGVARLAEVALGAEIFTAALDRELDDRKYILPGLGDFGDRLYCTYWSLHNECPVTGTKRGALRG